MYIPVNPNDQIIEERLHQEMVKNNTMFDDLFEAAQKEVTNS
jgi:hypothetical protein